MVPKRSGAPSQRRESLLSFQTGFPADRWWGGGKVVSIACDFLRKLCWLLPARGKDSIGVALTRCTMEVGLTCPITWEYPEETRITLKLNRSGKTTSSLSKQIIHSANTDWSPQYVKSSASLLGYLREQTEKSFPSQGPDFSGGREIINKMFFEPSEEVGCAVI